jgi:hypothetical protein
MPVDPYNPAEFLLRLNEMVAVKNLQPKDVHDRTGIPYDQLSRVGTGPRGPSAEKLKGLVLGLEVDANFLLDTDERYRSMGAVQRAANMSLDRYLTKRQVGGDPASEDEATDLRRVADHSDVAPVWSADWEIHVERIRVSAKVRQDEHRPDPPARVRRQRRLQ